MTHKPFGPWYEPTKYKWRSDGSAHPYDGGGHAVQFPMDREKALLLMRELENDLFIDKSTLAWTMVVSFFIANLKIFAALKFHIAKDATGEVGPYC